MRHPPRPNPTPEPCEPDLNQPLSPNDADDDLTSEQGPERTCIVSREKHSPDAMIRFVLSPEGMVVPDIRRKLPGRGVWVLARAERVALAAKKQAFARGFKKKVAVPDDLAAMIDRLLETDALQSLSFASKAGAVTTGFVKVSAALANENLLAVLNACDAGPEGLRKLAQVLRRKGHSGSAPVDCNIFTSLQMDLALGRANVIHAAIRNNAAGAAFLARALRLARYRPESGGNEAETGENAPETDGKPPASGDNPLPD